MSGLSGRSSPDLGWGRKKFEVPEDAVWVLDRAASVLVLGMDPGEGFEVLLPVHGRVGDVSVRMIEREK